MRNEILFYIIFSNNHFEFGIFWHRKGKQNVRSMLARVNNEWKRHEYGHFH